MHAASNAEDACHDPKNGNECSAALFSWTVNHVILCKPVLACCAIESVGFMQGTQDTRQQSSGSGCKDGQRLTCSSFDEGSTSRPPSFIVQQHTEAAYPARQSEKGMPGKTSIWIQPAADVRTVAKQACKQVSRQARHQGRK